MDRIIQRLGRIPLGGVAIALIVALTLWRPNMNRLGYEHALPTVAVVVAIAAATTVALRYMLGGWARAGIAASLLAAVTFYSVPIARAVGGSHYLAAIVLAIVVAALLLARRIPGGEAAIALNGKLNILLTAFAVFLSTSIAFQQIRLEMARPDIDPQFAELEGNAAPNSPDVWHILFDRYASNEVLAQRYGFDNRPFLAELEKRGFTVGSGNFSNYQRTAHSVATTLNGASLDRLARSVDGSSNDWVPIYRAIAANEATKFFDRNDYRTVFAGTWWSPTRKLNTHELISYRALPELGRLILDQSIIGAALRWGALPYGDGRREQCERENAKFRELKKLAGSNGRNYVFAHFLVPHPPFVLNADGSCRTLNQARAASRRDNYVAQVEYVNRQMIRLVDSILAGPGDEVIVVHSDEGPWPEPYVGNEHGIGTDPVSVDWRHVDSPRLREKMGILMAVRGPAGPPATMPSSPVQIYPAILRDHFGSRQPLPENKHEVFESDSELYRFHDIASKLGS
ncbi:MAG TPA: hypothetical protein VFO51_06580 [Sphingomicrobium sp.]|nr:hypothetical protein [Sphingomicrobium sp.]